MPKNGHARIGFNGLAFKAGTDDLRESPIVLIAEHLIGKGYDVKIHDQGIETSMITGANREYIQRHIPHLSSRLVRNAEELVEHSEVLLLTRDDERLQEAVTESGKQPIIVDLRGKNHTQKRLNEAKRRSKPEGKPAPEELITVAAA